MYAAQAADVLIQAIAQSNGSRADVTKQLFKVNLQSSILGNVSFNTNALISPLAPAGLVFSSANVNQNVHIRENIARVGVNYRFW